MHEHARARPESGHVGACRLLALGKDVVHGLRVPERTAAGPV